MDVILRDLRCAFRRLLKSPGFTVTSLVTLGLCLGANLTIFAVVDAVLLRGLPFPEAERLVTIQNRYPGAGVNRSSSSLPNYYDRKDAVAAFSSLAIYQEGSTIVGSAGSPNRVEVLRVSPEFFRTLGVTLARGDGFTEEHLAYGRDQVAVLTDEYWRVHFSADPDILGKTFLNDGLTVTVIGVLPPGFRFLSTKPLFLRPSSHAPEDREIKRRHSNNWNMVARLAPGVTIPEAQAQIDAFNVQQLATDPYAQLVKDVRFHTLVDSLRADHVRDVKPMLLLLQAGVLFLLLIGCVNLVNLLLIRATGRTKELAVRQALGAGRGAIALEVLTETTLLALAGGVLGLALGAIGIGLLRALGTDQLPLGSTIVFDSRLALAAAAAAVVVGVLLAIPVIWLSLHARLAPVLHTESRSGTATRSAQRLRHVFIVTQVALAFVLLTGAGLLGLSFKRVLDTPPGFTPEHVLTGKLALPWKNYQGSAARRAFVDRLLPALQALPSVTHVAVATSLPFSDQTNDSAVTIEGHERQPGESLRAHYISNVSPDYAALMRIPVLRGRFFEAGDGEGDRRVCVIDQAVADRYWPGGDPIGHRLEQDVSITDKASTIVGVVASVKQTELAEDAGHGAVYFPYRASAPMHFTFLVRSTLPPAALAPMLQKAVLALDPELPIDDVRPMQSRINDTLITRRAPAILAGLFAAVALLLAGIGTYGVLSYAVAQRQREIGVRIALGALPGHIRGQFVSVAVRVLVAGTVLGALGAWLAAQSMQSLLFGVPALHVATLAATFGVMAVVTFAACLVPATRAARVDPIHALRAE